MQVSGIVLKRAFNESTVPYLLRRIGRLESATMVRPAVARSSGMPYQRIPCRDEAASEGLCDPVQHRGRSPPPPDPDGCLPAASKADPPCLMVIGELLYWNPLRRPTPRIYPKPVGGFWPGHQVSSAHPSSRIADKLAPGLASQHCQQAQVCHPLPVSHTSIIHT